MFAEAATRGVLWKKLFLKSFENFTEKQLSWSLFLINLQGFRRNLMCGCFWKMQQEKSTIKKLASWKKIKWDEKEISTTCEKRVQYKKV